ncbi:hypothetical protein ZEAMMB73_Zm00001d021832 [Zea mays]|uniref:HD-Zip IV C-terminal domain-containing protein n=1 Tax=Zea mays TaxID=4577 RepID=A0A1D6IGW2_MAIZE|nr:hypothetical protein ZEAMMB73_Zm00001d021832 [Zea mays]
MANLFNLFPDSGQPDDVVLSVATSIWLPRLGDHVFAFGRDKKVCFQWEVLSHDNQVQEVSRIPNGSNPDNCISLLRTCLSLAILTMAMMN